MTALTLICFHHGRFTVGPCFVITIHGCNFEGIDSVRVQPSSSVRCDKYTITLCGPISAHYSIAYYVPRDIAILMNTRNLVPCQCHSCGCAGCVNQTCRWCRWGCVQVCKQYRMTYRTRKINLLPADGVITVQLL